MTAELLGKAAVAAGSGPIPAGSTPQGHRLPFRTKLSYGLGEMAEGVKSATLETFLFFYYVQVVGLSGSLTGLALLIALLFDGIADPVIGNVSDNFRSRLGRRHPFLYLAPVPLAVCLFLLFSPPPRGGEWQLFAWLLGFTALGRLMQSFYFVPHMALGAELSADFHERVSVAGFRTLFTYIGRLTVLALAFSLFFRPTETYPDGQLNPSAYTPLAIACGVLVVAVIFTSALGTQRRAQEVYAAGNANGSLANGSGGLIRNLMTAFRVKAFTIYFVAILISYVLGGVQAALNIHVNTYFWRLPPSGVQTVLIVNVFGFMAGAFLARALAHRFDKKPVYVASVVISVSITAGVIALALAGVYPMENKPLLTWLLAASSFASGLTGGPAVVVAGAMLADVADAYQHKFQGRSEGFLFGASAFTRKASLGLGGAIAGVALDIIRFPRGVAADAVPLEATVKLAVLFGPAMLVFTCISMSIMWTYPLSRERHAEILSDLERRQARPSRA